MEIPFHRAFLDDEEINMVVEAIKSGWITMGQKLLNLKKSFQATLIVSQIEK